MTHLEVLVRRRNFLERQVEEDEPDASAWDKRELEALDWAIGELE
jgi:hypothetical protein